MNAVTRIEPPAGSKTFRAARPLPASYDEADRSFDVVWSTGAAVVRPDAFDGGYFMESLSMEPGAVRLERLNDGAPLLDSHNTSGMAAIVGSVVPGSARVSGGQGLARVRLADTPDVESIAAKIRGGHVRKVSNGRRQSLRRQAAVAC